MICSICSRCVMASVWLNRLQRHFSHYSLLSVNNLLSNAMYTLSHNYLQESCINSKFLPGGSSFLVESVTQASIFYSVLFPCYERISAFRKKSIIEHAYLLSNAHYFLYIDYWTGNAFSTLMTKAQSLQPLYYINVMTEVLWYTHQSKVVIEVCVHEI